MINQKSGHQLLRIIGGQWRSRNFRFPEVLGLRPTPNRVRETLFNWLQGRTEDAKVLDLFTGSGALFLEALSRGAQGTAIDINPLAVRSLEENLAILGSVSGKVLCENASHYLKHSRNEEKENFNLIFLDPPFHQGLLSQAAYLLEEHHWIQPTAWIYTESELSSSQLNLPANWQPYKEKQAGQVFYALWQKK
ncbi:UNVERIFIED_CONTAM: hypothetical protein GTU68_052150 [Idotea baltica]|nr:hypothetical protein [Idotea baltica]